mmetsp:Transcript_55699/g.121288  ORF Transcript_55699/g.121288 Transcript_55699/m.121288 type:complete len:336 (+) Transcript_55699:450-1457(+)
MPVCGALSSHRVQETLGKQPPVLLKSYRGYRYATDGDSYWFSSRLGKEAAAVVVILDYLNGTVDGLAVAAEVARQGSLYLEEDGAIARLREHVAADGDTDASDQLGTVVRGHAKIHPASTVVAMPARQGIPDMCVCGVDGFSKGSFEPGRCGQLVDQYREYVRIETDELNDEFTQGSCSVCILNRQVAINTRDIEVGDSEIRFRRTGAFAGLNFASCQCMCGDEEVLGFIDEVLIDSDVLPTRNLSLPPIHIVQHGCEEGGHGMLQLQIDLFNNGFVVEDEGEATTWDLDTREYTHRELRHKHPKDYDSYSGSSSGSEEEDSKSEEGSPLVKAAR